MIAPEPGRKAGKKKGKGKKAKSADARDAPVAASGAVDVPAAPAPGRDDGAAGPVAIDPLPSAYGTPLIAWIDRVQERVDHLLTLVDEPAAVAPEPTDEPDGDDPTDDERERTDDEQRISLAEAWARRLASDEAAADERTRDDALTTAIGPATDEPTAPDLPTDEPSTPELPTDEPTTPEPPTDEPTTPEPPTDEPTAFVERPWEAPGDDDAFEPAEARLSAVLVARELLARGQAPSDVRRRLREGYGVLDPDAVLARVGR